MDKNHPSNSTYCSYLWQHVCVRPNLQTQACCRFEVDNKDILPSFQANFDNVTQVINSKAQQNLRAKALRGETIPGCEKCRRTEQRGEFSLRNLANSEFPRRGDETLISNPKDIHYLEIFTGLICNLKCLTCGPNLSTTWRSEYQALGWPYENTTTLNADYGKLINQTPHLRQIKFVGGEPFLSSTHDQILEAIPRHMAQKMKLVYYTNVTIWPDEKVLEQWKRFARVELWLSIDGFESVNDYIRFPSRWSQVAENTEKYFEFGSNHSMLKIAVNCTVSVYNVFSLNKLEEWMKRLRSNYSSDIFHLFHLNPLISPAHMDIQNMPEALKTKAEMNLNMDSDQQRIVGSHMRRVEGDSTLMPKLIDFTLATDRHRKQNVQTVVPELASLFLNNSL
jgi:molybdenum cofactor biosynthesis enzyme MoaA